MSRGVVLDRETMVAAEALRERGLKCTRQRLAVLKVLAESGHHLSAAEVHGRVCALQPGTGLATVYRTLELLADLNLIARVHLEDGCHTYAATRVGHRHQLICSGCGLVVEFADCPFAAVSESLAQRTDFRIEAHRLQVYGKCKTCAERV